MAPQAVGIARNGRGYGRPPVCGRAEGESTKQSPDYADGCGVQAYARGALR